MSDTQKRRVRSKSPQDMFKEFNKSKLQRLSKNFGRESLGEKELEMEKKFKAIRLNKYKVQKFSGNFYLILITVLGVIVICLLLSALNIFQKDKQFLYCSDSKQQDGLCEPCPIEAVCENGKIIQCPIGTFLQANECVSTENIEVMKRKMREDLKELLQYRKGDAICHGDKNKAYMKISQIENYLRNQYKGDQYFEDSIREFLFDIRYDSKYQNLFESSYDIDDNYDKLISAKEPKFGIMCSLGMAIQKNKFLLIFVALIIATIGIAYLRMKINKKYTEIAERIYKDNLQKFNKGVEEINTQELLQEEKDDLKPSQRDKVMNILEDIRKKDEQLAKIEKHGVIYWVKM